MEEISPNVRKLKFGELEIYILNDGHFYIDPPQPTLAPNVGDSSFRSELKNLGLLYDDFKVPIITLLVKQDNRYILIDTGEGNNSTYAGKTIDCLEEIGIVPAQVTDILLSHAHSDHIGGIFSDKGDPSFPNAYFYLGREEWEFWNNNHPKGQMQRDLFCKIKDRLLFFEPGKQLFSSILPLPAFGHTPGHYVFLIQSTDEELLFIADIFHSPVLVVHPEWGCQWDVDFEAAVDTRLHYLKYCSDRNLLVVGAHLPWPGIGEIGGTARGNRWVSVYWP